MEASGGTMHSGIGSRTLAVAALVAFALPVRAATIEGVSFDPRVQVAGQPLALQGVGLLRYRLVFKAYVAGLYLGEGIAPGRVFDDVPKRLEIEYFWPIEGADFGPAAEKVLSRTLDARAIEALRPRLDAINARYRSVRPGDRYALTYLPGRGTELSLNGEPLTVVPGADFARHYFGIWLGSDPIDEDLRDELTGG